MRRTKDAITWRINQLIEHLRTTVLSFPAIRTWCNEDWDAREQMYSTLVSTWETMPMGHIMRHSTSEWRVSTLCCNPSRYTYLPNTYVHIWSAWAHERNPKCNDSRAIREVSMKTSVFSSYAQKGEYQTFYTSERGEYKLALEMRQPMSAHCTSQNSNQQCPHSSNNEM